jgi:hypothetical protein
MRIGCTGSHFSFWNFSVSAFPYSPRNFRCATARDFVATR